MVFGLLVLIIYYMFDNLIFLFGVRVRVVVIYWLKGLLKFLFIVCGFILVFVVVEIFNGRVGNV